jgi:Protein of unknown function (DUF2752)
MDTSGNSHNRTEHLWLLGVAAIAIVGSFVLIPVNNQLLSLKLPCVSSPIILPETCMFRRTFGIPCPGCGLTRSFVAMAHGRFLSALRFNTMGPIIFVFCVLQIPYRIAAYTDLSQFRTLRLSLERRSDLILWIITGGLMISWAVKVLLEGLWWGLF